MQGKEKFERVKSEEQRSKRSEIKKENENANETRKKKKTKCVKKYIYEKSSEM